VAKFSGMQSLDGEANKVPRLDFDTECGHP
jgi:hypothetical protein